MRLCPSPSTFLLPWKSRFDATSRTLTHWRRNRSSSTSTAGDATRIELATVQGNRVGRDLDFQDSLGSDRRAFERTALRVEKDELTFEPRRRFSSIKPEGFPLREKKTVDNDGNVRPVLSTRWARPSSVPCVVQPRPCIASCSRGNTLCQVPEAPPRELVLLESLD